MNTAQLFIDAGSAAFLAAKEVKESAKENSALKVDREDRRTVGEQFVTDPRMTCRDVNVYYGDNHAIKNVSIDINRNEVLAMIGPSGFG